MRVRVTRIGFLRSMPVSATALWVGSGLTDRA